MDKNLIHKTDWKLGETVKPDDLNRLEGNDKKLNSEILSNANEIKECIKKDGSVQFDVGEGKGIKIGANIDIIVVEGNLYIRNKTNSNDYKSLQITDDGFVLPAGNLQLGSGNYRFREAWVGADSKEVNGFSIETNGRIKQWGWVVFPNQPNNSSWVSTDIDFPIEFPNKCISVQVTADLGGANFAYVEGGAGYYTTSKFIIYAHKIELNPDHTHYALKWEAIGC
ncbi:MAG: gp53-like domain-containing protein [Clostridium sp.]